MKKAAISAIAAIITLIVSLIGIFDRYDHYLTDFLYQRPVAVNTNIKIVAIDEKSLAALGPYNKWDRASYAALIDAIYKDPDNQPAVTVFDVIFQGDTGTDSDAALAEATQRAGSVVSAANMVFRTVIEMDAQGNKQLNRLNTDFVEYPYEGLKSSTSVGFANTIQDTSDNGIRHYYPYLYTEDREDVLPGLATVAAGIYAQKTGNSITIPTEVPGSSVILRYTGRPGDYETLSIIDILEGRIPPQAFKDSVLFIGAYSSGMMDAFNVPTGLGTMMYGVEIHANIFQSILDGRYMTDTATLPRAIVYALIAFVFALMAQLLPMGASAVLGVLIVAVQIFAGIKLADAHSFVPLITLPICIVLIEACALALHYAQSLMQRQKVLKAFRQYVAPQVVEEIAKRGDYELKLGGEKRNIAVLFVDIRGFTPLSEALEPEQVVAVLNEYLALTTKSIFDNGGTLDKFVGDATMAVFNSPFDLDDYVYRAVCAARDIVAGSEDIRKKAFEMTGKNVGFGVGVNFGEAVVGNIGCDFRMDYTAIGDTVNTAARLEANAKAGQVLLSPAVVEALGDRIEVEPVGELALKGKAVPMKVSALVRVKD